MEPEQPLVTQLLRELGRGNKAAYDELMPVVYDHLRRMASRCLRSEHSGHTLPATALVHEAYLRLVGSEVAWEDRAHFYRVAARVMRRILVDHAKNHNRQKRGGGAEKIPLDEAVVVGPESPSGLLELDEVLGRLAAIDERKAQIVEFLFFAGLTYDETAEALQVSPATVHRELKLAKAWLHRELTQTGSAGA